MSWSTVIALCCLVALGLMIWGAVRSIRRDSAKDAKQADQIKAKDQTIEALITGKEIEDAVNSDPDLVNRASQWVRPAPK